MGQTAGKSGGGEDRTPTMFGYQTRRFSQKYHTNSKETRAEGLKGGNRVLKAKLMHRKPVTLQYFRPGVLLVSFGYIWACYSVQA